MAVQDEERGSAHVCRTFAVEHRAPNRHHILHLQQQGMAGCWGERLTKRRSSQAGQLSQPARKRRVSRLRTMKDTVRPQNMQHEYIAPTTFSTPAEGGQGTTGQAGWDRGRAGPGYTHGRPPAHTPHSDPLQPSLAHP